MLSPQMSHLTYCSGNRQVPGCTFVTITLDFVPLINAQLRKKTTWKGPFPQEWGRAALSLAQAQANPAR